MYLGGSLFLFALGAILAFAVQDSVEGIDLGLVGWILMGVALAGLVLSLLLSRDIDRTDRSPPNF